MRDDMAKVIVERPRRGGGSTRKGRAQPLEDLPSCEGMRRPHIRHFRGKELNENLAPLRRYFDRQVGRPWRKIFSEVAAHLRVASTVDQHVRDHVRDFVALSPRPGIKGWRRRADDIWFEEFYVDPADGLLKRTADLPAMRRKRRLAAERRRAPRAVTRIVLDQGRELRRIDGIWYELSRERPAAYTPEAIREFRRLHSDELRVATKRQLGRRELQRFGLANDDDAGTARYGARIAPDRRTRSGLPAATVTRGG